MIKNTTFDHIVLIVTNIRTSNKFYSVFLGKAEEKSKNALCYRIDDVKLFLILPYEHVPHNTFQSNRIGLNHLAFRTRTLTQLKAYVRSLDNAKIKHSGIKINKYSKKEYVWFDDPDGIRLEFYLRP